MTDNQTAFFQNQFYGKSILKETDLTTSELNFLVDYGLHLKTLAKQNIHTKLLDGKNIALVFEKNSTRTRSAFTTAANELGAHPVFLGKDDIHLFHKESVEDTAKVLGGMYDAIEFRGYRQSSVEALAEYSGVPVWNGLTDDWHPTQTIPDLITIKENFGKLAGLKVAYLGDGRNNVAHSLLVGCAMAGVNIAIVSPASLQPDPAVVATAQGYAKETGATITITADQAAGLKDANVVTTDVWVSMGEDNWQERIELLLPYQVNMDALAMTGHLDDGQLIVLHCLPAFHDLRTEVGKEVYVKYGLKEMEITDEVFQSKYGRQFDEAENRKHGIKAIMAATLGSQFIPKI
ncbi:ornithine carbamoyltransferase [Fructobacillus pseudoficulneus]|uniref:Ornithine carbamoyltransferase n=1 Tax=Fructobacillus pseudoficulneus TaxID=220714 RepID=A0A3F3GXS0_9LACO|nr:ornithine carbamoyltransferase [Fructobacillus pseudoficulneus]GAP02892.1 ornithine carbamoyltransferase [Fructobacillus pseudoficulneus]SEH45389.1 ornithine carbamoyltransferase [Fructobacillus pseudoficulneus]